MGFGRDPTLRPMALARPARRAWSAPAALGSAADRDEATVARRLLSLLHPGMLVPLDPAFDANAFLRQVVATGAPLVARAKLHPITRSRRSPAGRLLTWSDLAGWQVRVIEAARDGDRCHGSRIRTSDRLDRHADWTTAASRPPWWSGSTT